MDQKAMKRLREIVGEKGEASLEKLRATSPDLADYILHFVQGDVYSRRGLSDRELELAAVTSLVSQGKTGVTLKTHLTAMLHVGWTKKDIQELLLFMTVYVGFPAVVEAMLTLETL